MVQHFSEHNIAIIHSKQCCETAIASLLSVELKSFLHYRRKLLSQREVHQLGFSLEPLSVLEIRQILNTIKALSCTFIILICQSNTAQFLSTVGATHTLLTFGTFFVTLKLNTNVKLKSFPIQLISLNLELKDNYYFSRSNLDGDVQSWIFSKLIPKERKEENKGVKKSHSSPRYGIYFAIHFL